MRILLSRTQSPITANPAIFVAILQTWQSIEVQYRTSFFFSFSQFEAFLIQSQGKQFFLIDTCAPSLLLLCTRLCLRLTWFIFCYQMPFPHFICFILFYFVFLGPHPWHIEVQSKPPSDLDGR